MKNVLRYEIRVFVAGNIILFAALMVAVVAFQCLGYSNDYYGYIKIFLSKNGEKRVAVEPFFYLLRYFNDVFFPSTLTFIFCFTSCFSFYFKYKAISAICKSYCDIIFICYIFSFFLIHEYTQIRVSCALAVFFLSLNDLIKNRNREYFVKVAIAICFHYSSILMVVFYLYIKMIRSRLLLILFPVFGFIFSFASSTLLGEQLRSVVYIIETASGLSKSGNVSDFMSPFNLKYLMLLVTFILHALKTCKLDTKNIILLQSVSFGLCCYYWLLPTNLPVIAVRFAEFYTCVFVIYYFSNLISFKKYNKGAVFILNIVVVSLYFASSLRTAIL